MQVKLVTYFPAFVYRNAATATRRRHRRHCISNTRWSTDYIPAVVIAHESKP